MPTKRSEDQAAAAALAAAAFGVGAPLAYFAQRLYERSRSGAIDPTMVLRESHTALYWRSAAAVWWAGIAAVLVFAWAVRRAAPTPRWLRLGVPALMLALGALAWRLA